MKIALYLCYFLGGILICEVHADAQSKQYPVVCETFLINNTNHSSNINADGVSGVYENEQEDDKELEGENELPSAVLDKLLKEDLDSDGLMSSVLSGLTLFYNVLSNTLLYPVFSVLLGIMTIFLLVLIIVIVKKLRTTKSFSAFFVIATSLYLMTYIDLFLVVHDKRKILFLCFKLEKEIVLISIAAFVGFIGGRYFFSKSFEEKEVP